MPPETRRNWVLASSAILKGFAVLGRESYTLGRGQDCMIPLASTNVSRRHCEVAWGTKGPGYWVTDLGSTNGTMVNGQPVKGSRRLEHDDVISVGNVTIKFLCVEGTKEDLQRRFDPRSEETNRIVVNQPGPVALLSGRLTRSVLHEVCQLIEMNRRTGELRVRSQGLQGLLCFSEGLIVDAKCGIETGETAARLILGFRSGEYAFGPAAAPPKGKLKLRALALVMDLAREEDEMEKTRALGKIGKPPAPPDDESTERLQRPTR